MKLLPALCISALFSLTTGCATVFGDNTRSIKVDSSPAGAAIYVDGQQYGVTPAIVTLPNHIYGGKSLVLKKTGYQDQSVMINSKFQPITLLDIFFWPTLIVDALTGDMVKIDPNNLNITAHLQAAETTSPLQAKEK